MCGSTEPSSGGGERPVKTGGLGKSFKMDMGGGYGNIKVAGNVHRVSMKFEAKSKLTNKWLARSAGSMGSGTTPEQAVDRLRAQLEERYAEKR